ncbi:DUF3225 domain-containing protein [Carboxylicivirga mesophila]|uniref:DUF3225 domain-containing protein n=1 Tax=Carboxylicivirga mesophila TaxID=1166478 RepID=A0ABS5KF56_9BACT|nr:DUF4440 domain-containing protein [Carboxylicivirga mesophila]MBS2213611.1 DUF3225 domain-containing protein [Carboxylicivirga mesophila]
MKTKLSVKSSLFVLLALIIASACTPVKQDVTAEIEEMNIVYMTAVKNQDVETLVSLYTDNAVILPSNQKKVEGLDAIRQMWNDAFAFGMGYLKLTTTEATAYGHVAHETGIYMYYTRDDKLVDEGKFIVVWEKVDNNWKIARDIWNSSMPMPPRATDKDTVAMVITEVAPEKMEALNTFASEVFLPAFEQHFADSKATARLFKVINESEGNAKVIYFIDPINSNHVHDVKTILSMHYNEEDTDRYMEEFRNYLIKQDVVYAVPMGW